MRKLLFALGLAIAACGGSSTDNAGTKDAGVCSPGEMLSCTGTNGCSGTKVCFSTGAAYGPCDCTLDGGGGGGGSSGSGASGGSGGASGSGATGGSGGTGGTSGSGATGGSGGTDGGTPTGLPATCAEAATAHTYVGCDFWPTVTPNLVWSIFDFAVLVTNPGTSPAAVTVTRNGAVSTSATVQPGSTATLYLPWIPELKGLDSDMCGTASASGPTTRVNKGAYHLTSSVPVAAYQFNALEYQPGGQGKDWSTCPGSQVCASSGTAVGCFSYSNDASLLLPTTSLGATYRVTAAAGWSAANIGPYVAVTGTTDGTTVTVQMPAATGLVAGAGITAPAGGTAQFSLDAGDVVELSAAPAGDLGGALITADHPIQLVSGMSCVQAPVGTQACDHVEETILPATALGRHYVVAVPTGPHGTAVGHMVRFVGHVDGTNLVYPATTPVNAPTTLAAGQVVEFGPVVADFEVTADKPFAIASLLVGGGLLDPNAAAGSQEGDPSLSVVPPTEQYKQSYVFVSASDYDSTYVDVTSLAPVSLTLDGQPVSVTPTLIGSASATRVFRIKLATAGTHRLEADAPVGVNLTGYGLYTSYEYPAGMDVRPLP